MQHFATGTHTLLTLGTGHHGVGWEGAGQEIELGVSSEVVNCGRRTMGPAFEFEFTHWLIE